jgi:gamma-glutamylcyclotransferase (GGCT)/AIG2-like uncharacterized protein YtfP
MNIPKFKEIDDNNTEIIENIDKINVWMYRMNKHDIIVDSGDNLI